MFNDWIDYAIFIMIIPAMYSIFLILGLIARWMA
jgi:hypothetical protein